MAIETLDLPIKNGGSFHSYVSLPEGSGAHKPTYNWEGAGLVDSTIYHIFTKKIQKIFYPKKEKWPWKQRLPRIRRRGWPMRPLASEEWRLDGLGGSAWNRRPAASNTMWRLLYKSRTLELKNATVPLVVLQLWNPEIFRWFIDLYKTNIIYIYIII